MLVTLTSRMIMTIKRLTYVLSCFLLFFLITSKLQGQAKDFQSWWELELDKELTSRLNLEGELEQRFKNNSLQYSRTLLTVAVSHDLMDFLRVGGGARTTFLMDGEQQMHARYRVHLDLTGRHDLSGFGLSLRSRLQYGFEELLAISDFRLNSLVNRNKLRGIYHIFGTKFDCFASLESWHGSGTESQWITYAMRYSAGLRYSPTFRSSFSLRYILEDEFNLPEPQQFHIVVLAYAYNF